MAEMITGTHAFNLLFNLGVMNDSQEADARAAAETTSHWWPAVVLTECHVVRETLTLVTGILERHAPFTDVIGMENCDPCSHGRDYVPFPCRDVEAAFTWLEAAAQRKGLR